MKKVKYTIKNVDLYSSVDALKLFSQCVEIQVTFSRKLYDITFISHFESTACLRFAKLQYVSSGFRCRVITGSLVGLC